ncbi:predicted protein [Histoplasma mississippiense (nom. inval.)]|uniref:predicted protein n=1 Tax=Ajellomyces capsulatus (strain NAm1 / WU24) TaxID=2059318 RepID=UPI000157C149|nr:predicted protein [Histoplasma mississippiense (nom. inval.)]EDN07995.1 predicted protein [Histoplasma mississippiense (nom. inval.)]
MGDMGQQIGGSLVDRRKGNSDDSWMLPRHGPSAWTLSSRVKSPKNEESEGNQKQSQAVNKAEEDGKKGMENWWVGGSSAGKWGRGKGKGRASCMSWKVQYRASRQPPVFTWSIHTAIEERIGSSMQQPPTAKGEVEIGRWTANERLAITIYGKRGWDNAGMREAVANPLMIRGTSNKRGKIYRRGGAVVCQLASYMCQQAFSEPQEVWKKCLRIYVQGGRRGRRPSSWVINTVALGGWRSG